MTKRTLIFGLVLAGAALLLAACAQQGPAGPAGAAGPTGPAGPAGPAPSAADLTCTECHNDTALISGHVNTWEGSVHGSGPATAYAGGRAPCSGCHSGGGFSDRIAAGITNPNSDTITTADPNPSRPDCRACHQIHETYTSADWALETTDPVPLFAVEGATYDGGMGNLCANCHQQRVPFGPVEGGKVKVTSTHWGGHHGPEAALLLGVGGAGVEGKPSPHYQNVENTCVTCHLGGAGPNANHSFMPQVATCQTCHTDAKDLDVDGKQTEIKDKLAQVEAALQAKGLLDKDGAAVVGEYPEAQAGALWNYLFVLEDKSEGVHNIDYANALLDSALEALK